MLADPLHQPYVPWKRSFTGEHRLILFSTLLNGECDLLSHRSSGGVECFEEGHRDGLRCIPA